jgi:menaquinone-specific isochorismate synthase
METPRGEGSATTGRWGVVSRTREVDDVSYRAFLEAFDPPRSYWAAPDGLEVAGAGAAARIRTESTDRFGRLRAAARRLFSSVDADGPRAARPRAFGGLSFFDEHEAAPPWEGFPAAEFVVPRVQIVRSGDRTLLTATDAGPEADPDAVAADLDRLASTVADLPAMRPSGGAPGVATRRRASTRSEWIAGVEGILDRIDAGELEKAVLATALGVELEREAAIPDVLERLRRTYPDCFRFLVQPDGAGFFGAPPERLVALDGRAVRTEALAGSAPRGDGPAEDDDLAASLVDSPKVQREQRMVADAIREGLAPFGEVHAGEQGVRKLATIQHLHTPVEATLADDEHVLSLVEALHPTPAVGGVPPEAALATVRDIETFERGWYAAPVGWFDADGDGEFAVAIRSAVGDRSSVTMFGGNGIVADSDPAEEWEEVQLKFRPILDELERS